MILPRDDDGRLILVFTLADGTAQRVRLSVESALRLGEDIARAAVGRARQAEGTRKLTVEVWWTEIQRQGRAAEFGGVPTVQSFQLARIEALLFLLFRQTRYGQLIEFTERDVQAEMLRVRRVEP